MLEVFNKQRMRVAILQNAYNIKEEIKINSVSNFYFSLPFDDPKNTYCKPFYYVRLNGGQLYRILPSTLDKDETGGIQYECEHVIATLIDTVLFGHVVIGNLGVYTADVIRFILNKQLEQHWVLGRCAFARQFEYGWEQENLLSALFSIPNQFTEPYIFRFDTSSYPWVLHLDKINPNIHPELYIRNRKNMLSLSKYSDPKNICTRLYCLGYGEGVNQLTIKEVNGGLPYIQSPQSYIDQYGIIERIWIDRRYEDPQSLLNAGQAMLEQLQEPMFEYTIGFQQIGQDHYDQAEVGKITKMIDTDTKEELITYITGVTINHDDIESSTLSIANKPTNIAETIADLADRQRIEMTYSQGATQLYAQSVQANADTREGAVISFKIPGDMRIINKVDAKIKLSSFRAYSRATEGGGATSQTTSSGGGTYTATSSGGGTHTSTGSGGGTHTSTASGGGIHRSTESGGSYSDTTGVDEYLNTSNGHDHGIDPWTRLAVYQGYKTLEDGTLVNTCNDYPRFVEWLRSGDHEHMVQIEPHSHEFTVEAHTHLIRLPDHTHALKLPDHTHWVSIDPHTHELTLPNHEHQITPGIYYYGNPKSFTLYINGAHKGVFSTQDSALDLTPYLLDSSRSIPRDSWLSVEVRPDDLAYICIDLLIQGFVQSRGDHTY